MTDRNHVLEFVRESNRVEGIHRSPTDRELDAHLKILSLAEVSVGDLENFVSRVQPDAELRDRDNMNVCVGTHVAPLGGPKIRDDLSTLLIRSRLRLSWSPYEMHLQYENLHPFTDGNGRSGRALWLWMMQKCGELQRATSLGFLHCWYYQSLAHNDALIRQASDAESTS